MSKQHKPTNNRGSKTPRKYLKLQDFAEHHFLKIPFDTDAYYLGVCNRIRPLVSKFMKDIPLDNETLSDNISLTLASYIEDLASECGMWQAFTSLCRRYTGAELPFYDTSGSDYEPEYPCVQSVSFLIWYTMMGINRSILVSPVWDNITNLAKLLVPTLQTALDNAPETISRPGLASLTLTPDRIDMFAIRKLCYWIANNSYLFRMVRPDSVDNNIVPDVEQLTSHANTSENAKSYFTDSLISFNVLTGPLACKPYEYLAGMLEHRHLEEENDATHAVASMQTRGMNCYRIQSIRIDRSECELCDELGNVYPLLADTLPDRILLPELEIGSYLQASLVYYDQYWHVNGLCIPYENSRKNDITKTFDNTKQYIESIRNTCNAIIGRLGNRRIGIFSNIADIKAKLDGLGMDDMLDNHPYTKDDTVENIVLFVHNNASITLMKNAASTINIPDNKWFDADNTTGYNILLSAKGPDFKSYLADNNLLPNSTFADSDATRGKQLMQDNMQFIKRINMRDHISIYQLNILDN